MSRFGIRFLAMAAVLVAFTALSAASAAAQGRTPPRRGMDRDALEQRLRARFGAMVADELGLDREAQEALAATVRRFDAEREELRRRQGAIHERLGGRISLQEAAAPGRSAPLLSDSRAVALLEEMRALRTAEHDLFLREQEALLEVLTPGQTVRFLALRDALVERVRQLRFGPRMRPPGGRGG